MGFRILMIVLLLGNLFLLVQVIQSARAQSLLSQRPAIYATGPQDADLTLVEFFDYTCDPCLKIAPALREALKKDGKVMYVARPVADDNLDGLPHAKLALAAAKQGKFSAMHDALISDYRALDQKRIDTLVASLGMDAVQTKKDLESKEIANQLDENAWLLRKSFGTSLPYIITSNNLVFTTGGKTPTIDDFLKFFNAARSQQNG